MRTLRLAFRPGSQVAPAAAFPGFVETDEDDRRSRWISGSLALLLHGSLIAGLVLYTWLNPTVIEDVIPVQLLKEEAPKPKPPPPPPVARVEPTPAPSPAPEPPKEKPAPVPKENPAPAPKALAERRTVDFAPQAQAVAPQVINPSVVAKAAPAIDAKKLEGVGVVAPREIAHATTVASVSPIASIAPAQASKIDIGSASPALRGPVEVAAPVGQSAGPRQVVTSGATVGTGTQVTNLGGSSVREGVVTGRDVLGSANGAPLASINTRVGDGNLRGDGGTGDGQGGGGGAEDCDRRPEVQSYLEAVKAGMKSRWDIPTGVEAGQSVALRFMLDVSGSVRSAEVVSASDARLSESAVSALRSASPFPAMPDRVRCLAGRAQIGTFRNPRAN
jgi:TonB family protein